MTHKTKAFYPLIFILISLWVVSCSKETADPVDMGFDYFPLEQGRWIIYDVRSIVWDDNDQSVDTTYYQLKTEIDTTFYDNLGRLSYRWNQYMKSDTSTRWYYTHTFALTRTPERLESVEGNNRFVRLAFPVQTSISWDVNAFNTQEPLNASYIDVGFSKNINGKDFGDCAQALLEDNTSLVNEYYREEIYGRGVGMLEKVDKHIDKELTGEITKGYFVRYQIVSYGKN